MQTSTYKNKNKNNNNIIPTVLVHGVFLRDITYLPPKNPRSRIQNPNSKIQSYVDW